MKAVHGRILATSADASIYEHRRRATLLAQGKNRVEPLATPKSRGAIARDAKRDGRRKRRNPRSPR